MPNSSQDLVVYVVWVPELGGQERHVADAARLIADPRAVHFWDGKDLMGDAYRTILHTPAMAWDVYLLFPPGTRWADGPPPAPVFWMHQLSRVSHAPKLDARVLGQELQKLSAKRATVR